MAIHNFVDTITTSVSLRVKQNTLKESLVVFSTSTSQQIPCLLPTPNLIQDGTDTYINSEVTSHINNQHFYFGITPAIFTGQPNVLNIAALNIQPNTPLFLSRLNVYAESKTYQRIPQEFATSPYLDSQRYNYYNVEKSIYIPSTEDLLELDWNTQTNLLEPQDFVDAGGDPDPGGGNGQSTLKEFWA